MGQESSQLVPSQDADGARIKQDPDGEEDNELRNVSNWESGTAKATVAKTKTTRGAEAWKKKRKKKSSSSLQEAQQIPLALPRKSKSTTLVDSNTARLRQSPQAARAEGVDALLSDDPKRQKKRDLEDRKRHLLAVAAAAAAVNEDEDEPPPDLGRDGPAISKYQDDERQSDEEDFLELESDAPTSSGQNAKEQRYGDGSGLVVSRDTTLGGLLTPEASQKAALATAMRTTKKSKSMSRLSLKSTVEKNTVDELAGQPLTPDANSQVQDPQTLPILRGLQTQDIPSVKAKRKSIKRGLNPIARPGKYKLDHAEEKHSGSSSDEELDGSRPMPSDIHFVPNSDGPDADILLSTKFDPYNGQTKHTYVETSEHDDPSYVSGGTTPRSSPPPGGTISLSTMMAPKSKKTRVNRKPVNKSHFVPQNTATQLADDERLDRTSFIDREMNLIDPALRRIDAVWTPQQQSIGIHRDVATAHSTGGRKRRLPVDDDFVDQSPPPLLKKLKGARSSLKPKLTKKKVVGVGSEKSHVDSLDVAQTLSTTEKRKHPKNSTGNLVPKAEMVKGRFSDEEMAIMAEEMQKYREMNDMTSFEQNKIIQDKPGKLSDMWDRICEVLPNRGKPAIVKNCRRKYHNYGVRGVWTKEEDEELRQAYERFPRRWKEIGNAINRHHEDVRDRWRNYVICGARLKRKELWTEEEENHLRAVVSECVEAVRELKAAHSARNPGRELDMRPDIELIDWQVVSEKLGHTRSRLQCLDKFNRLARMEDSEGNAKDLEIVLSVRVLQARKAITRKSTADFLELLLALRSSQAGREGKVPWARLGDMDLKAKWPCMERKVAWKLLRATVRGNENMKFQEIVSFLIDKLAQDGIDLSSAPSFSVSAAKSPQERIESQNQGTTQSPMPYVRNSHAARERQRYQEEHNNSLHYQLGEDEFDPDDIDGHPHQKNTAIDNGEDSGDGDLAMANDYDDAESADLDAFNQSLPHRSHNIKLRSPISFKTGGNENATEDFEGWTQSEDDDADMDIPPRRPNESHRLGSVDLG